ncbi:Lrp/AsnC family transcriptional regulator [Alicyclobacillus sp.]|uniref:Lrp/AsnC family transcriptional regulator n=1 Tax=Alicyclobacillus sp. TaxID=61169 RepID=UPI0025BDB19F|nr:Lrp/AsnC family transcriptional regulator [Alicyclobacillus sp.]MCL6517525.1 Lrp/AsnC family transcriptional regulator [Alicyclobacillus sp.]
MSPPEYDEPRKYVDELDVRIIAHLQQDGRKSYREIAEDVGVSERTVRMRVERLREQGVLQIVGVVSPVALGLHVVAVVQLAVDGVNLDTCIRELQSMREVRFIALTSGEYQLLVELVCRSYEDLARFLTSDMQRMEGIRKTNLLVELDVFKNEFRFV